MPPKYLSQNKIYCCRPLPYVLTLKELKILSKEWFLSLCFQYSINKSYSGLTKQNDEII